jgi:uncharacterized protein (TIRG00374 family)
VLVLLCMWLGLGELFAAVERADPPRFVIFLALSGAVFFVYAARWSVVLAAMGAGRPPLSIVTLVRFRAAEHAVSMLLPSAHLSGEPVRALLLRRRQREWTRAISSVAMDRVLDMTASSIAGPTYVAVFFFANEPSSSAAGWAMTAMLTALVALGALYLHLYRGGRLVSRLARRGYLRDWHGSLEAIERQLAAFVRTRAFATSLALSFLAEALVIAELWTLSRAFALPLSLPTLVGVMVGMGIAQLLPIPAAVGSLEATEVGIVSLAGGPAPLGLAVGLLLRLRETLWILVGLVTLYVEGLSWRRLAHARASSES